MPFWPILPIVARRGLCGWSHCEPCKVIARMLSTNLTARNPHFGRSHTLNDSKFGALRTSSSTLPHCKTFANSALEHSGWFEEFAPKRYVKSFRYFFALFTLIYKYIIVVVVIIIVIHYPLRPHYDPCLPQLMWWRPSNCNRCSCAPGSLHSKSLITRAFVFIFIIVPVFLFHH